MKKIKNFFNKNYYLLIFLIPFFEFFNFNKFEFSIEISFYFLIYSVIFITFLIIFFFLIEYILKRSILKLKLYLSFLFFLIFRHNFFEEKLFAFSHSYAGEISFIFIFFILILFFFLDKYFSKINFVKNFFLAYFFLIFFQFNFNIFFLKSFSENDLNIENKKILQDFKSNKNDINQNIYYIVVDAMTSIAEYKKYYPSSKKVIKDFETFIDKNNLNYYDGLSAYTSTRISFQSMLNLDYKFNEKSSSEQLLDYSKLYPEGMKTNNINKYLLINILNSNKYKILWEGPPFPGTCNQFNLNLCINQNFSFAENFVYKFILNTHILKTFFYNTPFDEIYYKTKLNKYFKKNVYSEYIENDAIGKFMLKTKNNFDFNDGPYFFLIHHMSPHKPYLYNSDCSKREPKSEDNSDLFQKGYDQAYQCVLKKIKEFINYINSKDENSIVVIQGDHGADFGINDRDKELNALNTFNLFKLGNSNCNKINLEEKVDMINNVRFVLSCALGVKPKLIQKRSFIRVNYGKINEKNIGLLKIR